MPFVFFDQVTARLRVSRVEHLPSHRRRALARVRAEDPGLARRLREACSGVLFSVPELAFLNFRKGSFEYVKPEPGA